MMKKMNNKGFAISTMLYGLLILIVLIILMIISIMAFNRKNSREFSEQIVNELEKVPEKEIEFQIGDYVSMTPTSTSYTLDIAQTGYSSTQTINPSELNLWRVIRINDDKTVDMVSEYVSSKDILIYGQKGYQNFVGMLNLLAKQYENQNYTVGSRAMGYNGTQTEYITNTTALTSTTIPQTSSTSSSNVTSATEAKGLGDIGYITDNNLVYTACGTLVANAVGTTDTRPYWIASRYYYFNENLMASFGMKNWTYNCRNIMVDGSVLNANCPRSFSSGFYQESIARATIRPIVTLKAGLKSTDGDGKSSTTPYVLS